MLNRVTLKGRLVKTPELRKKRKMENHLMGILSTCSKP